MAKMNSSIAKITRPRLPEVLSRPRLFRLLDQSKTAMVTWICGPAGSGKTTLAASYLDARKLPCLWYQIDEGDADIASFFYYMSHAAQQAAPRYRKPLPLLTPEYLLGVPVFSRRFFEELGRRLKQPVAIVFDDYHRVPDDSPFHEYLNAGFPSLPKSTHLIILSRNEPPKTFTRMRANKELSLLGWDEIRFTQEESKLVIRRRIGGKLNDRDVAGINEKAAGWAAGLMLMTEGARTQAPGSHGPGKHAVNEIFDYFAGEVLDELDSETRDFLLTTSFLPTMTARTAGQLSGHDKADRMLAALNRNNFFTEKHAESNYRYHPLFRDFLQRRMEETLNTEGLLRSKKRAAVVLEESGQSEDAVALFLQSGEWTEAARLISAHAPILLSQGRSQVVKNWIDALPAELVEKTPYLLFWRGACLLPFDPPQGRLYLQNAFESFKTQGDFAGMILSSVGLVNAAFLCSEFTRLDETISLSQAMLQAREKLPTPEIKAQVILAMFGALIMRRPGHPDIGQWEQSANELFRSDAAVNFRIQAGFYLALHYLWKGDFARTGFILDSLHREEASEKPSDLLRLYIRNMDALYQFIRGDCDACVQTVFEALRIGDESGIHAMDSSLICHGIAASLSSGNRENAGLLLSRLKVSLGKTSPYYQGYYYGLLTWKAMIDGDVQTARRYYRESQESLATSGEMYGLSAADVVMFEMLNEEGKPEEAEQYLAGTYDRARSSGSRVIEFMCLVVDTHVAYKRGDDKKGDELLQRTMTLGREQGFMNMYCWRPDVMSKLCARALQNGIETSYVQDLIRKRKLLPDEDAAVLENWPYPLQVRTLGTFKIMIDGKPLVFAGKVQQKPLALLKAIIAFGGKNIRVEQLTDLLWPDADGDAAYSAFKMALSRLRKLLGREEFVLIEDGRVTIDSRCTWVDVQAFERALSTPASDGLSTDRLEKAFALYRGAFLPGDDGASWTMSRRERVRSKYLRLVGELGNRQEQSGNYEKAAEYFERAIEIDNLTEAFYLRLMICYHRLGRYADGISAYRRCKKTLSAEFGFEPSPRMETLYRELFAVSGQP